MRKAGSEAETTMGEEIQVDERSQACPRRTGLFIYSPAAGGDVADYRLGLGSKEWHEVEGGKTASEFFRNWLG